MQDPRVSNDSPAVKREYPPEVKDTVNQLSALSVCGQSFTLTWRTGPRKGLPVSVYCVEPLCIDEGKCTGARFVPHIQQYTTTDTDDPRWGPRKLTKAEAIEAVREVAKQAEKKGAIRLLWDDSAIFAYIKKVWAATLRSVQGDGDPRSGWVR